MKLNRPVANLARIYGCTRQNMHSLLRSLEITPEIASDPDQLFSAMLQSRASNLRERLADPAERERIRNLSLTSDQ